MGDDNTLGNLLDMRVDVTVTAAKTKKFLDAIAGARVVPGPYEALMEHTDDFPHIEIALHVGHTA